MTRKRLTERVAALERQNRRIRVAAAVLAVAALVLIGVGWRARTGDTPSPVRARSIVLVDSSGRAAVRMHPEAGGLRISMLRGDPGSGPRAATGGQPGRTPLDVDPGDVRSSMLLHPAPGLLLYGPGGRRVARLGPVGASELVR